jgi:hypothetical protein
MFKCVRKDGEKKGTLGRKVLKDWFPLINTTDKAKKEHLSQERLAHHGASSGMTPLYLVFVGNRSKCLVSFACLHTFDSGARK